MYVFKKKNTVSSVLSILSCIKNKMFKLLKNILKHIFF